MVRKGSQQARVSGPGQQSQRQIQQQKRGRASRGGASQPVSGHEQGFTHHAYDQPAPPQCYGNPVVLYDLGIALQRMGVLPVVPTVSEQKLSPSHAAQTSRLQQLNAFLDTSYELQQRGHLLWVSEQLELQRGADLHIISDQPNIELDPQPAHFVHQQTPTNRVSGQGAISPTDVLMSPQTASTLLAAAMASQGGLSPSMTGSAAAQLLSPTALGFAPLLLQDLSHNYRRRLTVSSHGVLSPNGNSFTEEQAGLDGPTHCQGLSGGMHHLNDDHLLPPHDYVQMHGHGKGLAALSANPAGVVCGPLASSDLVRSVRTHLRHHHYNSGSNGARTPRDMMLPSNVPQQSPLSPADLLLTAAGMCPREACMDIGLLGSYGGHHHGNHLDCDLHAELRLEAGGPFKRTRR